LAEHQRYNAMNKRSIEIDEGVAQTFVLGSEHGLPGWSRRPVLDPQSTVSRRDADWKPWRYTRATKPCCNSFM